MHEVMVLGAGKIGRMIAALLGRTGDYHVTVGDTNASRLTRLRDYPHVTARTIDATDRRQLVSAMRQCDVVISALSFHFNVGVAEAARETAVSYLDLTEDVDTAREVSAIGASIADGTFFAPQCGLAPGFVSILANHIAQSFDSPDTVQMRVGALPQFPSNSLAYNLTWSTDGLINEYCNPCEAILGGQTVSLQPLEGLEYFWLHGVRYEAFNTSGGLGTLCESMDGRVRQLDYKTIRYPGHQHLMTFLINELRLKDRREVLKDVLEHALPVTFQDMVVVFCTVTGRRRDQLAQISQVRRIYSRQMYGELWSAIQLTTAGAVCAVLDLALAGQLGRLGLIRQEQINLDAFDTNRFGRQLTDVVMQKKERDDE